MPQIEHPQDAIIRVTRSCICGSDLHLYHGLMPDTRVGTTFGHEFCGIVEEVGPEVEMLKVGDHVLVPFNIACGKCLFCNEGLFGNCHEANPEATASGGMFGYSHTTGGYDGGQAEYVRVPYADVGPYVPGGQSKRASDGHPKTGQLRLHKLRSAADVIPPPHLIEGERVEHLAGTSSPERYYPSRERHQPPRDRASS